MITYDPWKYKFFLVKILIYKGIYLAFLQFKTSVTSQFKPRQFPNSDG